MSDNTPVDRFFLYDPEGDYTVQTFPTEAERDAAAAESIRAYVDSDGWSEDVERIVVGVITGRATQCDVNRPSSKLDESCEDDAGTYWGEQVAAGVPEEEMMTCDYRIEPVYEAKFRHQKPCAGKLRSHGELT